MSTTPFPDHLKRGIGLAAMSVALYLSGFGCQAPHPKDQTHPADLRSPTCLTVVCRDAKTHRLTAADLQSLKRQHAQITERDAATVDYEGVALTDILTRCGVRFDHDAQRKQVSDCVVIRSRDGYQVVFSMAEVSPGASTRPVILADRRNGQPIDDKEGKLKLIAPNDGFRARFVRGVSHIQVKTVAPIARDHR